MSFFRGKRKIMDSKVPFKREYLLVPRRVNISPSYTFVQSFKGPLMCAKSPFRPRCERGLLHLEYQECAHHLQRHLTQRDGYLDVALEVSK